MRAPHSHVPTRGVGKRSLQGKANTPAPRWCTRRTAGCRAEAVAQGRVGAASLAVTLELDCLANRLMPAAMRIAQVYSRVE